MSDLERIVKAVRDTATWYRIGNDTIENTIANAFNELADELERTPTGGVDE